MSFCRAHGSIALLVGLLVACVVETSGQENKEPPVTEERTTLHAPARVPEEAGTNSHAPLRQAVSHDSGYGCWPAQECPCPNAMWICNSGCCLEAP
jgi:hypothetical protein